MALAAPASAQAIEDDFWISGAGFLANVDTKVSSSTVVNPGDGTVIDLEDDLGLDDSELLPAIYAGAKLGGGFVITAEYYSLSRDTTANISRTIMVDDVTLSREREPHRRLHHRHLSLHRRRNW